MKTLIIKTNPIENLNISILNIDLQDFDPHTGVTFICTFYNNENIIIDRRIISMHGSAWQNWSATDNPQDDYDYVTDYCLSQLGIEKKI
jgi:hypothetical protein